MRESIKLDTDKGLESNRIEKEDTFDKRLDAFLSGNNLDLGIEKRNVNVQTLSESSNKEFVGDYVIANDFKLATDAAKITLSYKNGSDQLLVVKETTEEKMNDLTRLNHWGDLTVEEYLKEEKFNDPDVILPVEIIKEKGKIYRFYEALDSMNLDEYLEKHNKLPTSMALSIIIRTCNSLRKLHKLKVVHADFLLANILFKNNLPKIIDLDNSVKNPSPEGKYQRDFIGGNRFSMAPELLEERPIFDKTVDIYAATATLYKLIEGHWPYNIELQTRGMTFEEKILEYKKIHQSGKINFSDSISNKLQIIIKKGMNPNPKERYSDIKDFMSDLLDYSNSEKQIIKNEIEELNIDLIEKRNEIIKIQNRIKALEKNN